ncbi:MAG: hypothetical protein ACFE0R_15005 [Salinarimonas sp.]
MSTQPLVSDGASSDPTRRSRIGALARGLGLALAPMLLFLSIPVGLSGGFVMAWGLLVASLVLITLDAALFGAPR